MSNYLSYESSVLLKRQKFPYPSLTEGQVWFLNEGAGPKMVKIKDVSGLFLSCSDSTKYFKGKFEKNAVYSPTHEELFSYIGDKFGEGTFVVEYSRYLGQNYFSCRHEYMDQVIFGDTKSELVEALCSFILKA